jgi:hypothetical protein
MMCIHSAIPRSPLNVIACGSISVSPSSNDYFTCFLRLQLAAYERLEFMDLGRLSRPLQANYTLLDAVYLMQENTTLSTIVTADALSDLLSMTNKY